MRTLYVATVTAAVFLIYCLWTEERSIAASRYTDDIAELARIANIVVEAEVIDVESLSATSGSQISMTRSHLKVVKAYKGNINEIDLYVEYPGGNDGAQQAIAPGQPTLITGRRYVLFLTRFSPSRQWSIVGGDAGQVELMTDSDGAIAQREGRFEYFVQDNKSLTGTRRIECSVMRETDFRDLLETIIATGRPVVATSVSVAQSPAMHPQVAALAAPVATPVFIRLLITVIVITLVWLTGTRYMAK